MVVFSDHVRNIQKATELVADYSTPQGCLSVDYVRATMHPQISVDEMASTSLICPCSQASIPGIPPGETHDIYTGTVLRVCLPMVLTDCSRGKLTERAGL